MTLTVVSDEETGGKWGADWLVNHCADEVLGDCVLNTEPSGLQTVRFGEKSMLWVRFRVKVPGGHSAYPHTSPSANKIAASLIKDSRRSRRWSRTIRRSFARRSRGPMYEPLRTDRSASARPTSCAVCR